jgi:hypothetical protein
VGNCPDSRYPVVFLGSPVRAFAKTERRRSWLECGVDRCLSIAAFENIISVFHSLAPDTDDSDAWESCIERRGACCLGSIRSGWLGCLALSVMIAKGVPRLADAASSPNPRHHRLLPMNCCAIESATGAAPHLPHQRVGILHRRITG